MAVNKDKLRKRQREHAGIAVLPVTHSNEIVVRVKQSLAAGKGRAFLATEWRAWETCSFQCLPVHLRASSSPGRKVVGLLRTFLQGQGNLLPFTPSEPQTLCCFKHHVQALAAAATSAQGSRTSVPLLPAQLRPQLSPEQGLQKCSSSSAFKHVAMRENESVKKSQQDTIQRGCIFLLCGRSNTFI